MPQAARSSVPSAVERSSAGRAERPGRSHSFAAAVAYAARGLGWAARRQPNLRAHIAIAGVVLIAAAAAGFSGEELALLAGAIGLVLVAELLNTSIELLTNLVSPDQDPRAATIKDVSAGAVLVACGAAVALAGFLLLGRLWPAGPAAGRTAAALGIGCLAAFLLAALASRAARGSEVRL